MNEGKKGELWGGKERKRREEKGNGGIQLISSANIFVVLETEIRTTVFD